MWEQLVDPRGRVDLDAEEHVGEIMPLSNELEYLRYALMVFEILQQNHSFLEAFHRTFQLAALLAFAAAGLLAFSPRKITS